MNLDLEKTTYYLCYAKRPAGPIARCVREQFPIPSYQNVTFTAKVATQLICVLHDSVFPSPKVLCDDIS
jgi:hypothetical protein